MSLRFSYICCVVGVACLVGGLPLLHDRGQPRAAGPTAMHAEADAAPQLVLEAGGHQALIRTLIFTADGRELVSVSDDKTIRIWSVSPDGRRATLARTLRGQIEEGRPGMLAAAALSPPEATGQQRWLAVGGSLAGSPAERAAVRLHDYASGAVQTLLQGHTDDVLAVAFAPGSRWLASAGKDGTIRLWDLTALQGAQMTRPPLVLTGHTDHIYALAWSASGDRLAAGSNDYTVSLWDTTQLDQGPVVRLASLRGHTDQVRGVAFHPDGSVLASGGADQTIRLWRVQDGQAQGVFAQAAHKISALAFAPNGQWLLTGNYSPPRPRQLTLFAYPTGQVQRTFTGHDNLVIATAFHPSGQWVASGGGDDKAILLWDIHTGQILSRLASQGQTITAVGFAPDGQTINWGHTTRYTSDNDRGPLEQQLHLTRLVRLPGGLSPSAALRSRTQVGKVELTTEQGGPNNDAYRLHVRRDRKLVSTIERGSTTGYPHSAYSLTPDGQHLLSGGLNGVLTLYRLDGTPRATLVGHTGEVLAVAIAGDGRWALSGSVDQTLALWSLADVPAAGHTTLRPTFTLFPATDGAWVAWTPEGFFAASNNGQGARLVGYSLNQGVAALAQYVSVEQLYERFYRPDLLMAKLQGDPAKLLQQQGALIDVDTILPTSLPPQVAIVQPTPDFTTAQREVEVQLLLTDQGGGLGKVVWNIDGVTLGVTRASNPRAVRGQAIPHAQRLPLAPGTNTITVVAYDQRDLVASAQATVTIHLASPPPTPPPATPAVPPPSMPPSHALPPLVTFVASGDGTTVTQPNIEVQVTLTEQGWGIGKVLWTHNAAPVTAETGVGRSVEKRGGKRSVHTMAPVPSDPGKRMITKSFVLTPGTNTITVVAYTRDNDVASSPAVRTIHFATAPDTTVFSSQPALSMLVVGINRYRDKALWLRYAVPDGQELVTAVRQAASPLVRDVKVTTLFDEQGTMAELEAAFARVAAQTSSHDIFMLYLAGHGITLDGRYHFIPQDFHYTNEDAVRHSAITQDHLQRWLASIPARKSVLLIDTCESGSFSQSLAVMRGMIEKTAIDRLSRATGRATIVAATDAQPAMEGYEGHGVFTYAVLQGLQHADAVSGNRDGMTGLFELAAYVHTRVPEITMQTFAYEQIPQVHMQGSDFPVGVVQAVNP